jgi:hypothetical protein
LRIPRKLIGRRTPADKLKPWPLCTACIPSLPARIRERLPQDDQMSDETPTETPTPTETSTQRASKAASKAARERAAETARVERDSERRCIIVRYRRPRGLEMARRRCTSVVSRAHLTGICGRCQEYLHYHQLDRTELPVVAVDEDGLVAGPGRYLLDQDQDLGKWSEYLSKPAPAEEDQPSDADVVADYDQVIIDALRDRVAELEGDVAERDALVARLETDVENQTQALLVAESDKAYLSSAFREAQASVERLVETAREREQGIAVEVGDLADALEKRDRRIEELEDQIIRRDDLVEELEAKISRFGSVDVDRDALQRLERVERSLRVSLESAVSAGAWSSVASIATLLELVER